MGLFSKNNQQPLNERQVCVQRYNSARMNLLLVVAFTVINIIMVITNSDSYFLFSTAIPSFFVTMGMMLTGRLEYFPIDEANRLNDSFFVTMLVIAGVITLLYLLCWLFSKNFKMGWLVCALVLFVIDTVGMFFIYEISESILDIVFHAWVIISLVQGIIALNKLKAMPEEEPQPVEQVAEQTAETAEQPIEQPEQATDNQNL